MSSAGILAQAVAAIGMEVSVVGTGFGLLGFTKEHHELPFPAEFAAMAPAIAKGMEAANVASWDTMLRRAKELGTKVYTSSMMCDVMGLTRDDFNDVVDDLVSATTFLQWAEGGETFFIRGLHPRRGATLEETAVAPTLVDSRGSSCPGPITDLALAYRRSKVGDVIELWATDPGVKPDARAWSAKTANPVLSGEEQDGKIVAVVQTVKR